MGLILALLFAGVVVGFIIWLGFYSDKKRKEEMEWYHRTMERIADNEEKKRGKE